MKEYLASPFGRPGYIIFGNGLQASYVRDLAYAPGYTVLLDPSTLDLYDYQDYSVDDAGNIVAIDDLIDSNNSRAFEYDDLDRLTFDSGVSADPDTYTYDGNGNRLTRAGDVGAFFDQALTYVANSNVVDDYSIDSGTAQAVSADGMGNLTDLGNGTLLGYEDGGRLNSIWDTPNATGLLTLYNGLGELARTRIWTPSPCTSGQLLLAIEYFAFSPDGRILELVSQNSSSVHYDYVWLDDQPVAQFMDSYDGSGELQGTEVTYLHSDHLGTPRVGTNPEKQITWRWRSDAFGSGSPAGSSTVRLRHPGQVDLGVGAVTNNYYRDYLPEWGRYVESDPIGLEGGLNTYGYVGANPTRWADSHGLFTEVLVWEPVGWGESSFGHLSVNINGRNYSYGPGGWDRRHGTADSYIQRQRQFRSGVGTILNLSANEEAELERCLQTSTGSYNLVTDNCGTPLKDCLSIIGKGIGYPLFPVEIGNRLLGSPIYGGSRFYPGPRRGFLENIRNGTLPSAPWAH